MLNTSPPETLAPRQHVCEVPMYAQIGMPQGAEWIVILVIVVLVFGAAKLPDLARSTGQALKIFKSETKGLIDDDSKDAKDAKAAGRAGSPAAGELPAARGEQSDAPGEATTSSETSADRHPG